MLRREHLLARWKKLTGRMVQGAADTSASPAWLVPGGLFRAAGTHSTAFDGAPARRRSSRARGALLVALAIATAGAGTAAARTYRGGAGVPELNVKGSCSDAQKFSTGDDKNNAYKGCMQDEMNAKNQLAKRWSQFKVKDRSDCVEQARTPSPSYVEVLTCLEMDTDAIANAPKVDGRPVPQIGGPVAPGLPNDASPK